MTTQVNKLFSVASFDNESKNIPNVRDLVPNEIEEYSQKFIQFVEEYYKWLESNGNPAEILNSLYGERDVDFCTLNSLNKLIEEFMPHFPKNSEVDTRTLLKTIVTLFRQKGSEEGIRSFFKIFFGKEVEIYFPWRDVLIPSDGIWDDTTKKWKNNKGFLSDKIYLHDSWYYQRYSYEITSGADSDIWENSLLKTLHPSGHKLFATMFLLILGEQQLNAAMPREQVSSLEPIDYTWLIPELFNSLPSLNIRKIESLIGMLLLGLYEMNYNDRWNSLLYSFDYTQLATISHLTQQDLINYEQSERYLGAGVFREINVSFSQLMIPTDPPEIYSVLEITNGITFTEAQQDSFVYFSSITGTTSLKLYTLYRIFDYSQNTFKLLDINTNLIIDSGSDTISGICWIEV